MIRPKPLLMQLVRTSSFDGCAPVSGEGRSRSGFRCCSPCWAAAGSTAPLAKPISGGSSIDDPSNESHAFGGCGSRPTTRSWRATASRRTGSRHSSAGFCRTGRRSSGGCWPLDPSGLTCPAGYEIFPLPGSMRSHSTVHLRFWTGIGRYGGDASPERRNCDGWRWPAGITGAAHAQPGR